jgi:hypothetical protein
MLTPFFVGKGGRKLTPEEVDRERELVALARSKMGDTSPVGHWTQGATRVVDALGAVLREKRTNKAEAAGLAGADERIAAIRPFWRGRAVEITPLRLRVAAMLRPVHGRLPHRGLRRLMLQRKA